MDEIQELRCVVRENVCFLHVLEVKVKGTDPKSG